MRKFVLVVALLAAPAMAGYSTDFEAPAFTPGFFNGQGGWATYSGDAASTVSPAIVDVAGNQVLEFAYDSNPVVGQGYWALGAFSPDLGVCNYLAADITIDATGGADYSIQPQAAAEGLLTTRMLFSYTGDIMIYGPGSEPDTVANIDTGYDYTPGVTHTVAFDMTDGTNINYILDGTIIATTPIFAGTMIDEVFLSSDNYSGSTGYFDNIVATPEPATLALLVLGGFTALRRRR